jgi:hypothetical protein
MGREPIAGTRVRRTRRWRGRGHRGTGSLWGAGSLWGTGSLWGAGSQWGTGSLLGAGSLWGTGSRSRGARAILGRRREWHADEHARRRNRGGEPPPPCVALESTTQNRQVVLEAASLLGSWRQSAARVPACCGRGGMTGGRCTRAEHCGGRERSLHRWRRQQGCHRRGRRRRTRIRRRAGQRRQ